MADQKITEHTDQLPAHIGIIMDGNGRWAKQRGLPRQMGHKQGAKAFQEIARYCRDLGIPYLTVYAFSTENWKRPKEEIDAIMDLLRSYLREVYRHTEENIRICFLGNLEPLEQDVRDMALDVAQKSKDNTGITVNIALNYGGRAEITMAAKKIAQAIGDGTLSLDEIDEECFASYLYTAGQPDPDLIIRPSGEMRLSNFLPWQSAYSEFIFMNVLWPDFTPNHLDQALKEYRTRSRRFGGI